MKTKHTSELRKAQTAWYMVELRGCLQYDPKSMYLRIWEKCHVIQEICIVEQYGQFETTYLSTAAWKNRILQSGVLIQGM